MADDIDPDVEAEYAELLGRLSSILTRTAQGLKGRPPELTWHDWSDLPELAERYGTVGRRMNEGWLPFGWHGNYKPCPSLEFDGVGEDGLPQWERAVRDGD
jgi:hypothetical protein